MTVEKRTITGVCTPGDRKTSAHVRWLTSWVTCEKNERSGVRVVKYDQRMKVMGIAVRNAYRERTDNSSMSRGVNLKLKRRLGRRKKGRRLTSKKPFAVAPRAWTTLSGILSRSNCEHMQVFSLNKKELSSHAQLSRKMKTR